MGVLTEVNGLFRFDNLTDAVKSLINSGANKKLAALKVAAGITRYPAINSVLGVGGSAIDALKRLVTKAPAPVPEVKAVLQSAIQYETEAEKAVRAAQQLHSAQEATQKLDEISKSLGVVGDILREHGAIQEKSHKLELLKNMALGVAGGVASGAAAAGFHKLIERPAPRPEITIDLPENLQITRKHAYLRKIAENMEDLADTTDYGLVQESTPTDGVRAKDNQKRDMLKRINNWNAKS